MQAKEGEVGAASNSHHPVTVEVASELHNGTYLYIFFLLFLICIPSFIAFPFGSDRGHK